MRPLRQRRPCRSFRPHRPLPSVCPRRQHRRFALDGVVGLVCAAAALAPVPASAQQVHGLVLYNYEDVPVALATVSLIDTAGVVVASAFTDVNGRFSIPIEAAGTYSVHAEHLTAFDMVDGPLQLSPGSNTMVAFHMVPHPIALEALTVEVDGRSRALTRSGFFERQRNGFGYFVEPADIERRRPIRASDLLRTIPGVRFIESNGMAGNSGYPMMSYAMRSRLTTNASRPCFPRVYVDGIVVEQGGTAFGPSGGFDQIIAASDVAAMEVYRSPAETPVQFGGMTACGVILMWTRMGLIGR